MRLKQGRKLCKQLSSELKNQKNVNWESILSEPHYLRPRVEVDEVVFSLARMVEENGFNSVQRKQHAETRKGN